MSQAFQPQATIKKMASSRLMALVYPAIAIMSISLFASKAMGAQSMRRVQGRGLDASDTSAINQNFQNIYNESLNTVHKTSTETVRGNKYLPNVYSNTTASAANVFVTSDGLLQRSTSSKRYKTDRGIYKNGLSSLLILTPHLYDGKNEKPKKGHHVGFFAEDVDRAGLKEFVVYDAEGRPEALEYGNMTALLVNAIKEQQAQIEALKKEIESLKK